MGILLYVLSVIIILAGLLFLFITPVAGIIFIILGVGLILWQKKNRKAKTEQTVPVASPQDPEIEETAEKTKETHKVAGISHYTKAVESLGTPNPQYNYKVSDIKEDFLEDERIYKIDFSPMEAELVPEPDNEYDPNAISVMVKGKKIGYIKKGSTSHVKKLMDADKIKSVECEIVGGSYKVYDSEEKHLEKYFYNYGARLIIRLNIET